MIRIAEEADIPQILSIYAPYVQSTTVSFEYEVPSPEEFARRFRTITSQFPWLVWEEQGEILGYAYACLPFERAAYRWSAEPSIYLKPEAKGKGIGKRLYRVLEELLKLQGYHTLFALITGENTESLRFHEKMGYAIAGELKRSGYKCGRWLSVFWMEKHLQSVGNPSEFPTNWSVIGQDEQKAHDILYDLYLS